MPNVKIQRKRGKQPLQDEGFKQNTGFLSMRTTLLLASHVGLGNTEAVIAAGVAYAESTLNFAATNTNTNGSIDVGGWQINSVHKPVTEGLTAWTERMKNPMENAKAMRSVSGNGSNWKPWVAYGTDRFKTGLRMAKGEVRKLQAEYEPGKGGTSWEVDWGILDNLAQGIIDVGGDAAEVIGDVFGGFFGPLLQFIFEKTGEVIWLAGKWIIRDGFYGRLIHPQWEHGQRAFVYYYNQIMSGKAGSGYYYSYAGLVTVAFWSLGYAMLWRDLEDITARKVELDQTPIGRTVRKAQEMNSNRKLYEPKEAKKATPKKPKPKASTATIEKVRSARVQRRRTVGIEWTKEDGPKVKAETQTTTTEPTEEPKVKEEERTPVNG